MKGECERTPGTVTSRDGRLGDWSGLSLWNSPLQWGGHQGKVLGLWALGNSGVSVFERASVVLMASLLAGLRGV